MSELICVRPMTTSDVDQVVKIAASLKQAPQWSRTAYIDALNPSAVLRRVCFAAVDLGTGGIVGFCITSLAPPESELETIAVALEYRRRGVARRLFDAIRGVLRIAEVTAMRLEVRASNEPAQALYESIGFSVAGRRPRYYAEPIEDAVVMCLIID